MEIITFRLENNLYGAEIQKLKGISVYSRIIITKLHREKDYILGLSNFRGDVVAIVDLRVIFGMKNTYDENTIVLYVRTVEDKIIGVICDEIAGIVHSKEVNIQNPADTREIDKKYIKGFFQIAEDKMVTLLNIDRILEVDKI